MLSYAPNANEDDTAVVNYLRDNVDNVPTSPNNALTGTVYSNTSFFSYLACQTNAQNRIGRKVVVKSLLFDGIFTANTPGTDRDETSWQAWLILDKQCNGQVARAADVFSQPGANGGAPGISLGTASAYTVTQMPNIANRQRFQFLKEWSWKATPQDTTAQKMQKRLKFYKRMNLPVEYGGVNGEINEIKSNNLFLMISCVKQNGATAEAYWGFCGNYRIRFNDS